MTPSSKPSNKSKVFGRLIKRARELKGLTQGEFAEALKTSQSAVARIESGGQNLSIDILEKMSAILEQELMTPSNTLDFQIEGGHPLSGTIETNTSKNGAILMICAALLNHGTTILHHIPNIDEVYKYIDIAKSIGVSIKWIGDHSIEINASGKLAIEKMDRSLVEQTRCMSFIGALMHHSKSFSFPHSGGCKMGNRTIIAHKYALESLGVKIKTLEDSYKIESGSAHGGTIILYESSDTGAITSLIAAAGIPQKTVIKFAPPNYQVRDVCYLLQKFGVTIEGIGTTTLTVTGVSHIDMTVEHSNSEDPIEAMFFIAAAIVTDATLTITRCSIDFLELELEKLKHMGLKYKMSKEYLSYNERTRLVDLTLFPSKLTAPDEKLHSQPFPGINVDNLPFFAAIATKCKGTTLIHDWMWENRAIYFTELNKIGASITLLDPFRVLIQGGSPLRGAHVTCPPALRPSAIILVAMLSAQGTSVLHGVKSISRGYADIAKRLNSIGAKIKILTS